MFFLLFATQFTALNFCVINTKREKVNNKKKYQTTVFANEPTHDRKKNEMKRNEWCVCACVHKITSMAYIASFAGYTSIVNKINEIIILRYYTVENQKPISQGAHHFNDIKFRLWTLPIEMTAKCLNGTPCGVAFV